VRLYGVDWDILSSLTQSHCDTVYEYLVKLSAELSSVTSFFYCSTLIISLAATAYKTRQDNYDKGYTAQPDYNL